jgi:hypothetical protein
VRVRVTSEQAGLEKKQATGPNGRPAAEPRQDVTSDYRLNLEQKKGTEKDRKGKENMIRWEEK